MTIHTPDWVKNAVFYQIFPDRFCRSERTPHPPGLTFKPWGTPPAEQGYQGGDLYGVLEHLDYLQELGVNAVYLNPIFSSASNHRYHTYDYFSVDPLLGGNDALRALLDEMHHRDMRLILDGVFNHASRGFWPFHHVLENGPDSPYADWFTIQGYPLHPYDDSAARPLNYSAWNNLPALPKLNTDNPAVQEFIFQVAEYWLNFGIDGWRLDVPEEIEAAGFWETFRRRVKQINPQAYLVGEIWFPAPSWLHGDRFDAVMNYLFTVASLGFFGRRTLRLDYHKAELPLAPLDAPAFKKRIDEMLGLYLEEVNQVQLNLLDSHDTPRALWILGGDESALRMCVLFQMTMPGAPCIYYGDEIGLSGADDPDCRGAFPWQQPETWNADLLDFYRRAVHLRHQHPALRRGAYRCLLAENGLFAFLRTLPDEEIIVVFNTNVDDTDAALPADVWKDGAWRSVWGESTRQRLQGQVIVRLGGRSSAVFVCQS